MKATLIRSLSVLLVILFCVFSFASCGHIEDTNGPDDYSLQTMNDADILTGKSSVTSLLVKTTLNGKFTLSVRKLSGVSTPKTYRGGTFSLTVSVKTTSGNLRAVFCTADKIIYDLDVNADGQLVVFDASEETVYFRVAGESASCSIEIVENS